MPAILNLHPVLVKVRWLIPRVLVALGVVWALAGVGWLVLPTPEPSDADVLAALLKGRTVTRVYRTASFWPDGSYWAAQGTRTGIGVATATYDWTAMWPNGTVQLYKNRPYRPYFSVDLALKRDARGAWDKVVVERRPGVSLRDPRANTMRSVWGKCGEGAVGWMPRFARADSVLLAATLRDETCGADLNWNVSADGTLAVWPDTEGYLLGDNLTPVRAPRRLVTVVLPGDDGDPEVVFAAGSTSPSPFYRLRVGLMYIIAAPALGIKPLKRLILGIVNIIGHILYPLGIALGAATIAFLAALLYWARQGRLQPAVYAAYSAFRDEWAANSEWHADGDSVRNVNGHAQEFELESRVATNG